MNRHGTFRRSRGQRGSPGRWRVPVLVTVAALAASVLGVPAASGVGVASAPTTTAVAASAATPLGGVEITLITGDTVRVSRDAGGRVQVDVVDAVSTNFRGESDRDGTYLFPDTAELAVASGLVDRELFNVEYLAANGYDDATRKTLPVILDFGGARSAAAARQGVQAFAAAKPGRSLEVLGASGASVDKAQAERFWTSLTATSGPRAVSVAKVWLDRKVSMTLDVSVSQIGAPLAWEAGYDGTGVTVAVLDTGVDLTHPDLTGKVAVTRNFTSEPSVVDGNGHGTHVVSTIVGSGAASGGKYQGVAPGARLVSGKVLNDSGSGQISWIIDAMEWAAVDQDADIISVSVGGGPSDGTDPTSQAVNQLTETTGALFVIAAGNDGPYAESVNTPGAAARALTVGAVDKQNKLADFSSRGPLPNTVHVKPEITAPGVAIVAARAAGTTMGTPVDEKYTSANGTSMATPHVAGAAAILAQQHPEWTNDQLKATLVSSAADGGYTAWEQGAGRVDIVKAMSQQLTVDAASVSPGVVTPTKEPFTKTLTYTNTSSGELTITVKLDVRTETGESAPAGLVTVDSESITVPAGGTATVTVTINDLAATFGFYQGTLTATSGNGAVLRTPVGFRVLPEMATLRVRQVLPADAADLRHFFPGIATVRRLDDETLPWSSQIPTWQQTDDPNVMVGTVLVPAGSYSFDNMPDWERRSGSQVRNFSQVFEPEIVVDGDTTVTIDLRTLVPVTATVDRSAEVVWRTMGVTRTAASGELASSWHLNGTPVASGFWRYPTKTTPTIGTFKVKDGYVFAEPEAVLHLRAGRTKLTAHPIYLDAPAFRSNAQVRFGSDVNLAVASYADVVAGREVRGKLVYVDLSDIDYMTPCVDPPDVTLQCSMAVRFLAAAEAGAAAVVATTGGQIGQGALGLLYMERYARFRPIPVLWLDRPQALRLADMLAGRQPVTVDVDAAPNPSYEYKLWFHKYDIVPRNLAYQVRTKNLKRIDVDHQSEQQPQPGLHNAFEVSHVYRPEDNRSFSVERWFDAPVDRVEYHNVTGSEVEWLQLHGYVDSATGAVRELLRQWTVTDTRWERNVWNAVPVVPSHPRVPPASGHDRRSVVCAACRQGDTLWFSPVPTTGDGSHRDSGLVTGGSHLYRGDTEVPVGANRHDYPLSAGAERYRLENTYRHTLAGTAYGKTVQTTWNFTATARPQKNEVTAPYTTLGRNWFGDTSPAAYQPLIFLNYEIPLALDNSAKAGRPLWFTVHAGSPRPGSGADVRGMQVQASYDDGETWTNAAFVVRRGDGRFGVLLLHPKLALTTGAVSLRVKAWDGAGNEVVQTVSRAYGLTEPWAGADDRTRPGVTP